MFTGIPSDRVHCIATPLHLSYPQEVLEEIKLVFPQPLLGAMKFGIQVALYRGLNQFHHLRKLTIPGELLGSMVLNRLGQLEDLRYLKITSASAPPYFTLTSNPLLFQALRSLDIEGPLSFIYTLASVLPPCPSVRSLYLSVASLQSPRDSEDTLSKVLTLFPKLKNFTYKVKNLHGRETSRRFNLKPLLASANLVKVIIEHPHGLALSSSEMRGYLQAWPRAKLVLLNPNPALGHWRNEKGFPSILPSYDALTDLADFKGLKEFGVYLNNPQIIWDRNQVFIGRSDNTTLERLALGTVLTLDKRTRTAIQRKFPNATVISSP
ncbi:hypothetical protein BYT27DRAFT_7207715 [Phlegmacium glaucopus]|nr:hypothetical protein BYT27DRAFT_7207715 [Phlegmacium glaucopus]